MGKVVNVKPSKYKLLLKDYIDTQDEKTLYQAELVSKSFIRDNVPPDEIVNMHNQALEELYPDLYVDIRYSMEFLIETMIYYGLQHQELRTLREEQLALISEISVAASMQKTLLATTTPKIEGLDIGVISVPAEQMNGDYYHFIERKDGSFGIGIADVIGKGVPAALCMSMIKYSIDSFPDEYMSPKTILESLNRVVERNVDPSMFITMLYAQYAPNESKLSLASAGHEPGFQYHADTHTFQEIKTNGLVLGVVPNATYDQYELTVKKGDMIILLTDGVTECRQGDRFIEQEELLTVIRQYAHLSAQELVNKVFKHFERLQNFNLADDFTLIVLKKED